MQFHINKVRRQAGRKTGNTRTESEATQDSENTTITAKREMNCETDRSVKEEDTKIK
jgi:hypothetical protein